MDVRCPRCEKVVTGKNLEAVRRKARRHRCKKVVNPREPCSTARAPGLIKVPIGPFGSFGNKWVTPRKFAKDERARERREARQARNKAARRKKRRNQAIKKARQTAWGKKGKKKNNWIIPGILKW